VDNHHSPAGAGVVAWDDPDLAIDWGVAPERAILSVRDREGQRFADWASPFAGGASP
jgi:dTDP-4-dehydrorhamnose 3,5-epimerase